REDSIRSLRDRAGSQYDPRLVYLFLTNLEKFESEIAANGLQYREYSNGRGPLNRAFEVSSSPDYMEQIKQANREVFTLYSLAREFSSSLDLNETLKLFAEKTSEFVPYDSVAISLIDPSGMFAKTHFVGGHNQALFNDRVIQLGTGATGWVLKKRKPVVNVDPALDLSFSDSEVAAEYKVMAALPLVADDRLIGAISLYSSKFSSFQDEHIRLLETVSHIAADAISVAIQHAEAESNAVTDPMTGLPNSRSLRLHFEKEMMRAERGEKRFQLVVMDLDGFKSVNDTWGHKVGDAMLKSIGGVIKSQLREYDFLARYGGDEFVAIVPEADDSDTESLHDRIAASVEDFALELKNGAKAAVGISIGSASYPDDGDTLDILIEAADRAMYLDKKSNRFRKGSTETIILDPSELIFDANGYTLPKTSEIDETSFETSTLLN
ncbi:MAG: diguanylate cyclase, partial [Pyrinomonadaceae bacterium]